ncbi:MAG: DEAD/DEAH box helicase, partial [bacterium]|nr:DEAD/DEAH box helicase [bacterium]
METELTALKGVGPRTANTFASIGINTVWDLMHYFPRAYYDYSKITQIAQTKPGVVTIQAKIKQAKGRYVHRGMHITEAVASDKSGSVRLIWFNQPYRAEALKINQEYYITGKLELSHQRFVVMNPSVELVSDMPIHMARIVPVYRESKGVSTVLIRKTMAQATKRANSLPEVLPKEFIKKFELLEYSKALRELHFPSSSQILTEAQKTLGFIEIFELMLASKILKQEIEHETAPVIKFDEATAKDFVKHLPFKLTDAQRKSVWQIYKDINKSVPMNRLVEGDVGSGKTVVAAMAAVMTMQAGFQVALLAPTELLARQHAESINQLLKPLKIDKYIGLLVGNQKKTQKDLSYQALKKGNIKFAVGTHALLQDKV